MDLLQYWAELVRQNKALGMFLTILHKRTIRLWQLGMVGKLVGQSDGGKGIGHALKRDLSVLTILRDRHPNWVGKIAIPPSWQSVQLVG